MADVVKGQGAMTKEARADIVKDCYNRLIYFAVEQRKAIIAGGPQDAEWRTWDAIIAELQVARVRAVRRVLK